MDKKRRMKYFFRIEECLVCIAVGGVVGLELDGVKLENFRNWSSFELNLSSSRIFCFLPGFSTFSNYDLWMIFLREQLCCILLNFIQFPAAQMLFKNLVLKLYTFKN